MTLFDYVVLFVLACSIIVSVMRGIVKEMLSLAGWVAALIVANAYAEALGEMLSALPGHAARLIVAFIALVIGVKLLAWLLTMAIEALVEASGLTLLDRGLGVVFGLARGVVIVLAAVLVCGMTAIPQQGFWKNAVLSPMAESGARAALPYLPGHIAKYVKF